MDADKEGTLARLSAIIARSSTAMRRNEVNASCGLSDASVASRWHKEVSDGKLRILIQFGRTNVPIFGKAVNIYDLVKSDADRKVAEIIFRQGEVGRPVAATPGTPADRAAALKRAFMATMKDPEFLADAKKARLAINPIDGDQAVALFQSFYAMPKSVINAAKKVMDRK